MSKHEFLGAPSEPSERPEEGEIDDIAEETTGNKAESTSYDHAFTDKQALSGLEKDAPRLSNPADRMLNKKALAFMALLGVMILMFGTYLFLQFKQDEQVAAPKAEMVNIPDLPPMERTLPVGPVMQPAEASQVAASAEAIDVIAQVPDSSPDTGGMMQAPVNMQPPVDPLIEQRRISAAMVESGYTQPAGAAASPGAQGSAAFLSNPDKLLVKGTYLRCVLETKIVTDVPGFTSCIITEPVYSVNGQYVLIPKGSKAMGQYSSSNPSSPRLAVIWDRIITPTGIDVSLRSPGVDGLGASGHYGDFQTHWASRLGSALLISLISDTFKYAATEYGPNAGTTTTSTATTTNPFESETVNTLRQMANNQLERYNSRPNTITINQGEILNIYTAQDVDFSAVVQ